MEVNVRSSNSREIILEIRIALGSSMLKTEEAIIETLNEAGRKFTELALDQFDTNGDPIRYRNEKYTSKGQVEKAYQTPYGEIKLNRHVYQSSSGGETFCPLDNDARIITGSTPRFAKMVSSKYSQNGSAFVQRDFQDNHGRYISRTYIKSISDTVGKLVDETQERWTYLPPVPQSVARVIGLSMDGTCMFMSEQGWRMAMVGTISFYDAAGERLSTLYVASSPEYGKERFYRRFTREITDVRALYPDCEYIGIADGAMENWTFLSEYAPLQILDYFHAAEYVARVAEQIFRQEDKRRHWLETRCHQLKHERNGAAELLLEFESFRRKKMDTSRREKLETAITYFRNHLHQMNYSEYVEHNYPIGSGVIESACKMIIKQRLCNSGMKWKNKGAKSVLCLRAIHYSSDRWDQFWNKVDKYGC